MGQDPEVLIRAMVGAAGERVVADMRGLLFGINGHRREHVGNQFTEYPS